jgi:hypothetical protein
MATTSAPEPSSHPAPIMRRSVRFKFGVFVAVLLVVSVITLSWVGYAAGRRVIRDEIHQRMLVAAGNRHEVVRNYANQQRGRVALP